MCVFINYTLLCTSRTYHSAKAASILAHASLSVQCMCSMRLHDMYTLSILVAWSDMQSSVHVHASVVISILFFHCKVSPTFSVGGYQPLLLYLTRTFSVEYNLCRM